MHSVRRVPAAQALRHAREQFTNEQRKHTRAFTTALGQRKANVSKGVTSHCLPHTSALYQACKTSRVATGFARSQRRCLTNNSSTKQYEAVVVGGGPAGITVLGNLLERGVKPILWVDDRFNAGRVNARYREVPSNTKVKLFLDFATGTAPFRDIVGASSASADVTKSKALKMFDSLDPEKGCHLSHAADMLLMLTEGLKQTPGVDARQGRLTSGVFDEASSSWKVEIDNGESVSSDRLVLCTGSSPNNSPLPVHIANLENVDLDDALSPTKLTGLLSNLKDANIAVIGASHSAVLILRNLYNIAKSRSGIKVKWFTRHDLRYAEFMDDWILRDNTGLKGEAATWAKENLEPETMPSSDVSRYITKVLYKSGTEKETFAEHLQDVDHYIQAIGFDRDPLPRLTTSKGKELAPKFDHETGGFTFDEKSTKVPGLYGAGIAWPERVKDPYGNVEYAVGFFKFMKFVKRVSPTWN